ncbi:hypothetical protein ACS0TY_014513 [Phlomoides rotata]
MKTMSRIRFMPSKLFNVIGAFCIYVTQVKIVFLEDEQFLSVILRQENPGSQIYGQTLTSDHHDELVKLGINPSLKETQVTHKFPYVIFCAPPSRSPDYPGEVREATLKWDGEGCFMFTSSSAPYDCSDNGFCDEDTPDVPIGRSARTDKLLESEKVVMEAGGCVVRLAGLYKVDRGAHSYWLEKGTSDIRPDHILNLIHYEDAASLSIAILKKKLHGRIFLGCDNHPLSRYTHIDMWYNFLAQIPGTHNLLTKRMFV